VTLDITNFVDSPFNFVLSVKVLMRPTLNTYQFTFSPTQGWHLPPRDGTSTQGWHFPPRDGTFHPGMALAHPGMALGWGLTSVRGNRGKNYDNEPLVPQKHTKKKKFTFS
jgi:hypothetical protein